MSEPLAIDVCGDLLLDISLLRHTREPAPQHSDGLDRVDLCATHGGAWYLADILKTAYAESGVTVREPGRPDLSNLLPAATLSRAYQTWERVDDSFASRKGATVWRVRELMGCTVANTPYPKRTRPGVARARHRRFGVGLRAEFDELANTPEC